MVGVHARWDQPWLGVPTGWVAVLMAARAAGLWTNLELAGSAPEKLSAVTRPCLPHLDFLIVNDYEIGAITGIDTIRHGQTDPDACIEAAKAALALGASRFVVVHFPTGAVVATRDGQVLARPSLLVPDAAIAGANGAGDAFAAGFLYALHEDWTIDDALGLAHAAAAASLRDLSTTAAVEPWRACMRLAHGWGWRDALS
jgi:sugar/nucleoside kinase (ribokinase family)